MCTRNRVFGYIKKAPDMGAKTSTDNVFVQLNGNL